MIRRNVLGTAQRPQRSGMGIHVNRNMALELPSAIDVRTKQRAPRDERASLAAQFIPAGAQVLELGGARSLETLIPHGCRYSVAPLSGDFPTKAASQADVVVMLGALETVSDVETLFAQLRSCKRDIVLSYHPTDLGEGRDRTACGFVNHFSLCDLTLLFDRHGFRAACTAPVDESQMLMRLTPVEKIGSVTPSRIAVISETDAGHLGDRIGYHIVNSLLPGESDVHHLTFGTLDRARERYDLVVIGTGNSLLRPLLDERILDIVGRARTAIGIFGTQYRELIPRATLGRLLDRLDTWFARYEDDVLLYGRGRGNVVHLGDWLIDQFPMAAASRDEPLQIDRDIPSDLAVDTAIRTIQLHRQVYSARLAPLLCALTSAELAAYAEQPSAEMPGVVSGKYRSMLIDVFGRSFDEKKFFMVDRDAVARYKARVHGNVGRVRERIEAVLRDVTVAAV